ncbi:MAG: large conductance mechanosensitive channel protein MscL [Oscillospiraceae bacterium]|jgi:large conductance mechanosensitive channel|nr:large conductance mechanosensitive channel protein MscL [Oscillospiraceae bacterium]
MKSPEKIKKINKKLGTEITKISKKGVVAEFKEFISKGNVMNLAVGVIIGGAFQVIVKSVVDDIFMPVVGLFTKGVDFSGLYFALDGQEYESLEAAKKATAVISYGNFISALINFLIMAIIIFILVKFFNKITSPIKPKEEPEEKKEPRLCEFCCMEVDEKATRCPHCTSELTLSPEEAAEEDAV